MSLVKSTVRFDSEGVERRMVVAKSGDGFEVLIEVRGACGTISSTSLALTEMHLKRLYLTLGLMLPPETL